MAESTGSSADTSDAPSLFPATAPAPTLPRGMRFKDSKSAFYAVQDYALYHNKQVKVARRGGKHRKMVCASAEPCPFFVQLYLHNSKTDHTWYVSSADLSHSAECTSTAKPTQRQLVESASFQQALAAAPNGTAAQLLQQLKGRTNLRTIYRAKQIMKREHLTQVDSSYRKIPSLLRSFAELNPGSFTRYEVGGPQSKVPGAFSRAFVSCSVFTHSTTFNQQIYGLDVRPCCNSEATYQGVHLFLLGKDGNMRNVTIAAACCDAPTSDNYRWFFRCVEESGVSLRYCPVLCGIDAELLSLESELGLTFRYCTRYIIEHDLTRMRSFSCHHHALVWGLQGSETEVEYNNRLEWIGTTCGPGVETYLRQFPIERWVVAGNIGKVAFYGWRSRTFYETWEQEQQAASGGNGVEVEGSGNLASNAASLAAAAIAPSSNSKSSRAAGTELTASNPQGLDRYRDMLPFAFLEAVMSSFMQDAFERSTLAAKWKQQNRRVTQGAQDLYDAECKRIGEYKVSQASDTVAFVTQINKDPSHRRRVDLQTNTCSCAFIDQYAIPCRHLIAVLLFCEKMDTVIDRFAPGYLVDNYVLAFRGKAVELPLGPSLTEDPACAPPMATPISRRKATGADENENEIENDFDLNTAPHCGTKRPAPEATAA
ncbi:Mutatorlike Transposase [Phytophthora cinnamomi]|uniref:Mutatorlike Transposase n=1 Tax=Phytophthora cinnamomi TaxID=4785 RepID=UPI0035599835|nr:Mutatorlike Transposase [Phytophthora cinnamomi]